MIDKIKAGDTVVCKASGFVNTRYCFDWTDMHLVHNNEICKLFNSDGGEIECYVESVELVIYRRVR